MKKQLGTGTFYAKLIICVINKTVHGPYVMF